MRRPATGTLAVFTVETPTTEDVGGIVVPNTERCDPSNTWGSHRTKDHHSRHDGGQYHNDGASSEHGNQRIGLLLELLQQRDLRGVQTS